MKKKSILLITGAAIIVLAAAICISLCVINANSYIYVSFYGVPKPQSDSIQEQLNTLKDEKGNSLKFKYTVLDTANSLKSQLKRNTDLVFTPMGKNASDAADIIPESKQASIGLSPEKFSTATISMREKAGINSARMMNIIPLSLDLYEIDIDRRLLKQCRINKLTSWLELENFARIAKRYVNYPITFAGGDRAEFLNVIGSLVEAFDGRKKFDELVSAIISSPSDYSEFEKLVKNLADDNNAPLHTVTRLLSRWNKLGYISTEIYSYTTKDVLYQMAAQTAPIAIISLSAHRDLQFPESTNFSSIYIPSERDALSRYFNSTILSAVPLSKKAGVTESVELLISENGQTALGNSYGLAPVLATSHVVDHQADDVRYWVAATNAPLDPLSLAAFTDSNSVKLFADALIAYIKGI